MSTPMMTIDDLSAKLSRAAALLLHDDTLPKVPPPASAWQAAAKAAGLPSLKLPNDPVAFAIHAYMVAIHNNRRGMRPTEALVHKEMSAFAAAFTRINASRGQAVHA